MLRGLELILRYLFSRKIFDTDQKHSLVCQRILILVYSFLDLDVNPIPLIYIFSKWLFLYFYDCLLQQILWCCTYYLEHHPFSSKSNQFFVQFQKLVTSIMRDLIYKLSFLASHRMLVSKQIFWFSRNDLLFQTNRLLC